MERPEPNPIAARKYHRNPATAFPRLAKTSGLDLMNEGLAVHPCWVVAFLYQIVSSGLASFSSRANCGAGVCARTSRTNASFGANLRRRTPCISKLREEKSLHLGKRRLEIGRLPLAPFSGSWQYEERQRVVEAKITGRTRDRSMSLPATGNGFNATGVWCLFREYWPLLAVRSGKQRGHVRKPTVAGPTGGQSDTNVNLTLGSRCVA